MPLDIDALDPLRHPPARTMRPLYVDRLPPCNSACPAGENVQAWLAEAQAGRHREAWEIIVRDNPLFKMTADDWDVSGQVLYVAGGPKA